MLLLLFEMTLFACDKNVINCVFQNTSWIVDSGATSHVTPRKDFFSFYTPVSSGVLKMGNAGEVKVFGVGTVCLKTNIETTLVLQNVKHAPDIPLNLISVGQLDDDGYHNDMFNSQWKLTKDSLVVARGRKYSSLYVTQGSILSDSVNLVESDTLSELWHKRLSHMSERGIICLAKKNLLSGVKQAKVKRCVHCLAGKQKRVSFHSHPPSRKPELLELVHSDLCGPFK